MIGNKNRSSLFIASLPASDRPAGRAGELFAICAPGRVIARIMALSVRISALEDRTCAGAAAQPLMEQSARQGARLCAHLDCPTTSPGWLPGHCHRPEAYNGLRPGLKDPNGC